MYFPKNKDNLTMIIKIFRENGKSALHSPSPPWPFRGVKMHRKKVYIFNFTRKKNIGYLTVEMLDSTSPV